LAGKFKRKGGEFIHRRHPNVTENFVLSRAAAG
jgi:hypothetical protein